MTRDQLVERNCRSYELRCHAEAKGHGQEMLDRMTGLSTSGAVRSSETLTRRPDPRSR